MEEQTIQRAMESFLSNLNTEHTQQSYHTPLKHFGVFLTGQSIHPDRTSVAALTVDHAIDFVSWLRHECFSEDVQPAKATLQLYLTAVYRFYRSLLKRGVTFEAADIARLEETYRDARNIRGDPRPKDPKLSAVEAIIEAARAVPPVALDIVHHLGRPEVPWSGWGPGRDAPRSSRRVARDVDAARLSARLRRSIRHSGSPPRFEERANKKAAGRPIQRGISPAWGLIDPPPPLLGRRLLTPEYRAGQKGGQEAGKGAAAASSL